MKILLDQCVSWPLAKLLSDYECSSAWKMGWSEVRNGELLRRAEPEFNLFLKSDQNLNYQQNLSRLDRRPRAFDE